MKSVFIVTLFLWGVTPSEAGDRHELSVEIEKDAAEGLALITERMKSLSGGLAQMAEPPRLDQTIELPHLPEAHASDEKQES